MLTDSLNTILSNLGLSDTESQLYTISQSNPGSSATELSALLGIPRTSVYHTIEILLRKGLLTEAVSKGNKKYSAISLKTLLIYAKHNTKKARETELQVKKLVALIKTKSAGHSERKNIEVTYGLNGAWALLENVLDNRKDSYWIAGTSTPFNSIITEKDYFNRIMHRRKRMKKTMSYIIADKSAFSQKLLNQEDTDFRRIKILPDSATLNATIIIYGNKLGMISYGNELKTIVIEDAYLSDLLRLFHTLIWRNL